MFAQHFFNLRAFASRFFPKVGEDAAPVVVTPTGAIAADGVENYIGGTAALSTVSGSVTAGVIGGTVSGSVIGGTVS